MSLKIDEKAQEKIGLSLDTVAKILASKHLDSMTREALVQLTLQGLEELELASKGEL